MLLLTLIAFLLALGVVVAVHEWGHYRVAVACGVKVLRFSLGFGKVLWRFKPARQRPGQDTEFVIAAIPIGGYVKMLDERDGPVSPEERHLAFNTQPLRSRALIVAAGPLANLVLAVVLYALIYWAGVDEPRAVLSPPTAQSLAEKAGLQAGDVVQRAALGQDELTPVASFESLRWQLTRGALDGQDMQLEVVRGPDAAVRTVPLPLSALTSREPDDSLFRAIGIVSPLRPPRIGAIQPDSPAARAGLQEGDLVRRIGETPVLDGRQLREAIRDSGREGPPPAAQWQVERKGKMLQVEVQLAHVEDQGQSVGRLGAVVGGPPEMVTVRRGPWEGLQASAKRVWEVATLSLKLLGRMLTGELSLKHLSGPVAIADYAGKSAAMGWTYYLGFLAFVSVSLGVLNLLPVPVLDGGLLMYYLWEAVTGKPVTGAWLQRLQYVGVSLLLAMMSIAMFNDITARLG